jgi:hypothetical protein
VSDETGTLTRRRRRRSEMTERQEPVVTSTCIYCGKVINYRHGSGWKIAGGRHGYICWREGVADTHEPEKESR